MANGGGLPAFTLPSGHKGWIVAGMGALVGMIAGGIAINYIPKLLGWD